MRDTLLPGQQPPWPTFTGEGAGVFAHEFDIAKMNQACVEGDVNHDLQEGLVGKVTTEAGVVVSHEPSRVEVVPNQSVASSVTLG